MNEVIYLVQRARMRAMELNGQLAVRYGIASEQLPIGALKMAGNHSVVATELLTHYLRVWSNSAAVSANVVSLQPENAERVVEVTKAILVLCISAFEFSLKQAVEADPKKLSSLSGRVDLRKIIDASATAMLIPAAEKFGWEGVIELRNSMVHNNGIAEKTETYHLPAGPTISLYAGKTIQGELGLFAEVLVWSVEAFARWCD